MLKMSPAYVKALRKIVKNSIEDSGSLLDNLKPAPKTRFNVRIQKQRAFGAQSLPIKEVIGIAKATGTTLNDVVLAMCGGALRSYLIRHDELPKRALVAAVPVSLREVGDKSGANQVASMNCDIGTDIEDPVARLKAVNKMLSAPKKAWLPSKTCFPKTIHFLAHSSWCRPWRK